MIEPLRRQGQANQTAAKFRHEVNCFGRDFFSRHGEVALVLAILIVDHDQHLRPSAHFLEPRLRGTAVAIYFCCMYIFGASMGPVGTGLLSDHFAHKAMLDAGASSMTEAFKAIGLHNAMYAVPVLAVMAALVLFAASRTMEKDVRKQELQHQKS